MQKTNTACCALCQINDVGNNTSFDDLSNMIEKLTKEKNETNRYQTPNDLGQTSVFVIVSPGEDVLETNLQKLGFKLANIFERRKGYPEGNLRMFIKNLT